MDKWEQGIFSNGMAWSSIGTGEKVAICIPGGPGNIAPPTGWRGDLGIKPFRSIMEEGFRIVTVTRKQNMPKGHTVADMADDYASLVATEFGGQADLLIGISYGGMIAQHIAAEHPNAFKRVVLIVAACQLNEATQEVDEAFAKALSEGKTFTAGMEISRTLFPEWKSTFAAKLAGGLLMSIMAGGGTHKYFASDVLVEVDAEPGFNSREVLPKITAPVLLIAGDRDIYFPEEVTRETHQLIPNCTLRMYENTNHMTAGGDKRIAADMLEFISASDERRDIAGTPRTS